MKVSADLIEKRVARMSRFGRHHVHVREESAPRGRARWRAHCRCGWQGPDLLGVRAAERQATAHQDLARCPPAVRIALLSFLKACRIAGAAVIEKRREWERASARQQRVLTYAGPPEDAPTRERLLQLADRVVALEDRVEELGGD